MTLKTNARIAGFTFLFYIAAGITSLILWGRVTRGEEIAVKLGGIGNHPTETGIVILLLLCQVFSALVLAVTLWALTRHEDPDLALLGFLCRGAEGIIGGAGIANTLGVIHLARTPDTTAAHVLASHLLRGDVALTATFFAVGSLLFCYLFLRGRMIPVALAWIGIVASILLVVGLPLQLAGWLRGPIVQALWLPMLAFEVPLAVWLMVKGVRAPAAVGGREF